MKKPLQLAALLCGCLVTTSVFAQNIDKGPGFRYKGWDIGASVSVGAFWESNAHNSTTDDESGAGWRVQPSLTLSRQLGDRSCASRFRALTPTPRTMSSTARVGTPTTRCSRVSILTRPTTTT